MDEIEQLEGMLVEGRDQGRFVKGGVKITSERASEIGKRAHIKPSARKISEGRVDELAAAILANMPALATPEAEAARKMLVTEACDVACEGKGQARMSAITGLSQQIGQAFAEASRVEMGDTCRRCGQVRGSQVPVMQVAVGPFLEVLGRRSVVSQEVRDAANVLSEFWYTEHPRTTKRD